MSLLAIFISENETYKKTLPKMNYGLISMFKKNTNNREQEIALGNAIRETRNSRFEDAYFANLCDSCKSRFLKNTNICCRAKTKPYTFQTCVALVDFRFVRYFFYVTTNLVLFFATANKNISLQLDGRNKRNNNSNIELRLYKTLTLLSDRPGWDLNRSSVKHILTADF
ncbi:hypothetical protein BY458DRAFT_491943 [Sporodiniella umbellata]|nr:hypothetical protein BY458DRAFT_491943 [Sporodiniella umbellata]